MAPLYTIVIVSPFSGRPAIEPELPMVTNVGEAVFADVVCDGPLVLVVFHALLTDLTAYV
jgi:hypothetical protein